jgi:hypothetical protein
MKLSIPNKKDFISNVLNPVSNLNDKTIIKIDKNKISSITASNDATLVLYSETEVNIDADRSINIPDIKKLVRVLECVDTEHLDLEVSSNNIKYAGDNFKFTYHLLEDGIIKIPSINVKKINELKFDTTFKVTENMLSSLFKGSSFTTETNKLYIYVENNKVYGELGDKTRHNSDNFQCVLANEFTGTALTKTIPVNFETFRLINFNKCSDIEFAINVGFGVIKIVLNKDKTKLTYIVSALIN